MLREWATVVHWDNGIATLRCEQKSGCSGCQSREGCGVRIVNETMAAQGIMEFQLPIEQPLQVGQKVEIGINEGSLLNSALLIYLVPLVGLFFGAILAQYTVGGNSAVLVGSLVGGVVGFLMAKYIAKRLETCRDYQPIILQISVPIKTY